MSEVGHAGSMGSEGGGFSLEVGSIPTVVGGFANVGMSPQPGGAFLGVNFGCAGGGSGGPSTCFNLGANDSSGNEIFHCAVFEQDSIFSDTNWHSLAVSVDTSTHTVQVVADNVIYPCGIETWSSSNPISYGPKPAAVLQSGAGVSASPYGDLSDMRFMSNEGFFDLNANLGLVFGGSPHHPTYISWGPHGALITGTVPSLYLNGPAATYLNGVGADGQGTTNSVVTPPGGPPRTYLNVGTMTDVGTHP
jgi:hypothetical protein